MRQSQSRWLLQCQLRGQHLQFAARSWPDRCARNCNASRPHLLQHATQLNGQLTHGHLRCGRSRLVGILAGHHWTGAAQRRPNCCKQI